MAQPVAGPLVEAVGITREFRAGGSVIHALRGVDIHIHAGELVALRGRSGSGKTTLLNILTGIDDPTSGSVRVLSHDLARMSETARAILRRERVGMLFQNAHLFPLLTAQENVEIPLRLAGADATLRASRAREALALVGLSARSHHRGLELSGGEQQRVALARALAHTPSFVVADEPTGNLDSMTGRDMVTLLCNIAASVGVGFLVATHDPVVVGTADRVLQLSDGALVAA